MSMSDRVMYGVEGSTMTGIDFGRQPGTIVVTDPHGFVVPSAGVEIIRETLLCRKTLAMGSVFDRVIPPPGAKTGKRDIKIAPRKGTATKQRMRGLRP